MDFFDKAAKKIISRWHDLTARLKAYLKRLLFPLHFFPIKLITYSTYYLIKLVLKTIIALIKIIIDAIIFPFKSLKNFLKSIFIITVIVYMIASLFVIADYLKKEYGHFTKFFCTGVKDKIEKSVVRIVGGYSEGSGFFISDNQIITNFHVIADEPSPKIIFPDGSFTTPIRIIGSKDLDLAILFTENYYSDKVLPLPNEVSFFDNEPLISTGYPLGTELTGKATSVKGNFIEIRRSRKYPVDYIQTNITVVEGMSGGPLTDQCGNVVGINTISLAGLSLFTSAYDAKHQMSYFTDQEIKKIEVDPSLSPEEAVKAFYTYLKARRMKDGFNLLSKEYLKKTNFEEWTNRFTDILDVDVILSEPFENSDYTAFVKFSTKNWIDAEVEIFFYEGTWQTILEDGVYKMLKSNIKEVQNPSWDWFYE